MLSGEAALSARVQLAYAWSLFACRREGVLWKRRFRDMEPLNRGIACGAV
jgi:hypothetical protein